MKKAIKKIIALGMGLSMLGTVVHAADLNDYPAPFIQNGKFSGTLVVGDNAAAEDVVGVSDIAMSLQYAASVKTGTGSAADVSVQGDAWQIESSGNDLNLYEPISSVKSSALGADELNALADGVFTGKSTESYTQKLYLGENASIQYTVDSDQSDDPALYLKFAADDVGLRYELDFGSAVESDVDSDGKLEDFEDNKINILGKEYTVTEAINSTNTFTLMAGAIQDTMEVGETKTYTIDGKDYEVTVMIVSGDASATAVTKLIINDEVTKSLSAGETFTLKDGVDLGIKEVLPTKSGDIVQNLVEFYLGAQKLVLNGNDGDIDIGDQTAISGATLQISTTYSSGVKGLNKIRINWTPSDDVYVPVGATLSEIAAIDEEDYALFFDKLGIDYNFAGLESSPTEEVKIQRNSDDEYVIKFTNIDGTEYSVPAVFIADKTDTTGAQLGKDSNELLYTTEGDNVCEKSMFIAEDYTGKNSRVFEVADVKNTSSTKEVNLKDIGTGTTNTYSWSTGDRTIDFDEWQITVINDTCIDATDIVNGAGGTIAGLWTKYGSRINLTMNPTNDNGSLTYPGNNVTITLVEDEEQQNDDNTQDSFSFLIGGDGNDLDVLSTDESGAAELNLEGYQSWESNNDYATGMTKWGTLIEEDSSGDQTKYTITIPQKEAVGLVYVTAGVTSISSSDGVSGETRIVNKIDVGATKLASEVMSDIDTIGNLILVGGPCANQAVTAASDEFPTCDAATWPVEVGEAILQLVEKADGSVALLVAGTTAKDTRVATQVVAEMTELQALPDGVMRQKVEQVSGQLTEIVEVQETPADTTTTDDTTTDDTTTV